MDVFLGNGLLDVGWAKKSGDDGSAEKGKKWLERTVWMGGLLKEIKL